MRKHLHVACAIIEKNGKVLCAQRSASMSLPLKWEFPGGKINAGELPEECVRRELAEEMNVRVQVERELPTNTHRYPAFSVTLYPFVCSIEAGEIVLNEHALIAWLLPEELKSLDWATADLPVLDAYLEADRQVICD